MLIVMVDNEVYGEVIIDPLLQVCSMSNDPKTGNRTKVLYLHPFQAIVMSMSIFISVIIHILAIQNHSPDRNHFQVGMFSVEARKRIVVCRFL